MYLWVSTKQCNLKKKKKFLVLLNIIFKFILIVTKVKVPINALYNDQYSTSTRAPCQITNSEENIHFINYFYVYFIMRLLIYYCHEHHHTNENS